MQEWLFLQEGIVLYISLGLALIGGAFGLPIPEDIPLIAAGIAIHQKLGNPIIIFLVCYVAIVVGDMIIFLIGRRFGPNLFVKRWFRSKIPPSKIRKLKEDLEKRRLLMILLARHLFYFRTVTFLACGAVKMRPSQFIIADCIAALISVPIIGSIGYLAAEHYQAVLSVVKKAEIALLIAIIIALIYYFKIYKPKKQRLEQEDSSE